MTHYLTFGDTYELLPINKIILDNAIVNVVKPYGRSLISKGALINKRFTAPLNRMETLIDKDGNIIIMSSYNAMKNGIPLSPIVVKPIGNYYTIIDGRHRVAASLILGYNFVPAIIVK